MQQASTDVVINERTYRVGRMDAYSASWVRSQLLGAMLELKEGDGGEAPSEKPNKVEQDPGEYAKGMIAFLWLMASGGMDEVLHRKIQVKCLAVCSEVGPGPDPMPVSMKDGRLAKELEYEPQTVDLLVINVLQFNLMSFFLSDPSKSSPQTGSK